MTEEIKSGFLPRPLKRAAVAVVLVALAYSGWALLIPGPGSITTEATSTLQERDDTRHLSGAIPEDAWPESWLRPQQTASELGIDSFNESPMLAQRVADGELPPVEKRLPVDPIAIEPYESIGRYGGTLRAFAADHFTVNPVEALMRVCPRARETLPNLARKVEVSEDGKTVTIHLRDGLRWSDGHRLTSDDYVFWFNNVLLHRTLTHVIGPPFRGASIEKIDELTFAYHFPRPTPLFPNYLAQGHEFVLPKHFMKQFHPDFSDMEDIQRVQRRLGLHEWFHLFWAASNPFSQIDVNRPVLEGYHRVRFSPGLSQWERNPFYHKIDTEGNQLPYIDRIEMHEVNSRELAVGQAAAGQKSVAGHQFRTDDIPLLKRWEERYPVTVHIWRSIFATDVLIQPNLTHDNPRIQQLFLDRRFRIALSLGINRDEINRILYYGAAVPRQNTVLPTSSFYDPELETLNAEYDPERAKALLDEIGMIDRTGDGRREHPDGKRIHITLEYHDIEAPKRPVVELVTSHWREIGIHVISRPVDGALQNMRATGNMMDMTVWHSDRSTDILFPIQPFWYVPMHTGWEMSLWNRWSRWYLSDGERGEEPPPDILQLIDWWERLRTTMDEDERIRLGRLILRSQAENVWAIPTVGISPRPFVVRNEIRNFPKHGYWGWDSRFMKPYHPQMWFFAEEPN